VTGLPSEKATQDASVAAGEVKELGQKLQKLAN
jgi:hypothetical protein